MSKPAAEKCQNGRVDRHLRQLRGVGIRSLSARVHAKTATGRRVPRRVLQSASTEACRTRLKVVVKKVTRFQVSADRLGKFPQRPQLELEYPGKRARCLLVAQQFRAGGQFVP